MMTLLGILLVTRNIILAQIYVYGEQHCNRCIC